MKGKLQPSLCQSLSQIAFQIEAMTRLAQHARTVYLQLAALLRQLHRRLRLSQYVLQFLLLMARQRAANGAIDADLKIGERSEEHTSELQSLMRSSYAVFCLKKKIKEQQKYT